jgi:hypothetical protein
MPIDSSADTLATTATDARARLMRLQAERLDAAEAGVCADSEYGRRLASALEQARMAFVVSAVAELAGLRAELDAPLQG